MKYGVRPRDVHFCDAPSSITPASKGVTRNAFGNLTAVLSTLPHQFGRGRNQSRHLEPSRSLPTLTEFVLFEAAAQLQTTSPSLFDQNLSAAPHPIGRGRKCNQVYVTGETDSPSCKPYHRPFYGRERKYTLPKSNLKIYLCAGAPHWGP